MTRQLEAVLMVANHPTISRIMNPVIDKDRETIRWSEINYPVLSGGERAAISWIWCIWSDAQVPMDTGWRDPFDGFGVLDGNLQALIMKAFAHRWGFGPSEAA
jgi:hypothetical protein